MTFLVHLTSLLQPLLPMTVDVIGLVIHQVVLSIAKRLGAEIAGKATGMPVFVEGEKAGVN